MFDYQAARSAGLNDEQIGAELSSAFPNYDYQGAIKSGMSPEDVNKYLSTISRDSQPKKEERSLLGKLGRVGSQVALGLAEAGAIPVDLALSSMSFPGASAAFHGTSEGDIWDPQDLYSKYLEKDPTKQFEKNPDISFQGLVEKTTSVDLTPEDWYEKAARFYGNMKNPKSLATAAKDLGKIGLTHKSIIKAITPGQNALRSAGAAGGWQLAEENEVGPLGTIAAIIAGDLGTAASMAAGKTAFKAVTNPKQTAANIISSFQKTTGGAAKQALAKDLIKDAKEAGLQLDAGSITNSDLIKFIQARVAQSGLLGDDAAKAQKELSQQIFREYGSIVDSIGDLRFESDFQASEAIKSALKEPESGLFIPNEPARPASQTKLQNEKLGNRIQVEPVTIQSEAEKALTDEFLNKISPKEFKNDYQAGETLRTAAEDIKGPAKEKLNTAWEEFKEKTNAISSEQPELVKELQEFIDSNNGSLLLGDSTPEARVIRSAENLVSELAGESISSQLMKDESALVSDIKRYLDMGRTLDETAALSQFKNPASAKRASDRFGKSIFELVEEIANGKTGINYKPITLEQIIKSKRTLADIANWEFGGSNFKSAYKHLVGMLDDTAKKMLLNSDPSLLEEFSALNAKTALFKDTFENKNVLKLFENKNNNFASIYNSFIKDPDKLRSLEDLMIMTPRGKQVLNQVKRDVASKELMRPNLTKREISNLSEALGPDIGRSVEKYLDQRQKIKTESKPTPKKQDYLGIQAKRPETPKERIPKGVDKKIYPTKEHRRRQLSTMLKGKSEAQVMKMMDSVSGIRKMRDVLNLTPEGKKLFEDLSRYKVDQMILNKMQNNVSQQIKLGTFSNLLKSSEDKAIIKELIGAGQYQRLEKLQSVSGKLAESANKFFNASQSGVVSADVAAMTAGLISVLSGNPYKVLKVAGTYGGTYVMSNLLFDKDFLKHLEKAVLSTSEKSFALHAKAMAPYVEESIKRAALQTKNLSD